MRKAIRVVIVILEALLVFELLLRLTFGSPPLQWHAWYPVVVPLGALVFWPARRGN